AASFRARLHSLRSRMISKAYFSVANSSVHGTTCLRTSSRRNLAGYQGLRRESATGNAEAASSKIPECGNGNVNPSRGAGRKERGAHCIPRRKVRREKTSIWSLRRTGVRIQSIREGLLDGSGSR